MEGPAPLAVSRRTLLSALAAILAFWPGAQGWAQDDPLPSWNDGAAKDSIINFVTSTTAEGSASFVPPGDRIATFDQDGTTWVEHPFYGQGLFALDRLAEMAPEHPDWKDTDPFKAVLSGDREAMVSFTEHARKHGGAKRRVWRKIHLGIDEETLEIRAVESSLVLAPVRKS